MKKIIIGSIIALALGVILSGCGHNVLTYSSGKYLNFGIDPNTQTMGVQYINGEQITVVEKDNAVLTVETRDTMDSNNQKTTKIAKIVYEIKEQVTGADVDLESVKPNKVPPEP